MNESSREDRWKYTKILGFRIFAIHVVFLFVVVLLTIIHFARAWSWRNDQTTLTAFIAPLVQASIGFCAEGAFLYCLIRCKRILLRLYTRYQLLFIVILAVNTLFSFIVIAAGSTEFHYYWSKTPFLILVIDYMTAGMILLEVLLWKKFGAAVKCLRQEIMIVAPMKANQQVVQVVNDDFQYIKNNNVPAKKIPVEPKSAQENITELKEVHHYYTRMNVNGYVAKPEQAVIVRTPTLERKTYTKSAGEKEDDSLSLSSSEADVPVTLAKPSDKKRKKHNKKNHSPISCFDTTNSVDTSSLDQSRKSPYEEIPLNWPDSDKSSPRKKKVRPMSEIIQPRSPSPDMIFQVLPPKPWPPHGP